MNNYRIGVIGIPGKWSTEILADQIESKTGFRLVIDMANVRVDLESFDLFYEDTNLCELDGLVVKKISEIYSPDMLDRGELLRVAEASGVRVFSSSESIIRLVDRLSCTVTLRANKIPMPPTTVTESREEALLAIKKYGSAVLKPLYSTKARGMTIVDSGQPDIELSAMLDDFSVDNPMIYLQQKQELSGRDLGMVFLGGEYICTYARVAHGDAWNTTIHSGGRYEDYQPSEELIELGRRAQAPFGLDFTTVDIALTDAGPIVFEVSAFGGFKGAKEGCGVDAADLYSNYVIKEIQERVST